MKSKSVKNKWHLCERATATKCCSRIYCKKKHAKSVLLQILQEVLRVTRGTRSQLRYLLKTFCEKKSSGDEMQHNQIFQTLFSCKHLLLFFLRLCYDNFFQKFYIIICVFCLYNIRFKIFFCRLSGILECHMVAFLCLTSLKKCHELKNFCKRNQP